MNLFKNAFFLKCKALKYGLYGLFFTFLITGLCSCASLLRSDLSLFDDGEEEALEERKASEKKAKAFSLFSEKNASAQENNLIKQSEVFPFDENHLEPRLTRRVTKEDFIDQSQEEGSLWASSGQTNYYFTKNKIRSPGEMISLNVETDLFLDIKNEIKRSLSSVENAKEIQDLKNHYRFEMNKKRAQFFETQTGGSSTQTQNKEAPPNSKKDVAKDSTEESLLQKPLSQFSINDVDIEPSLFLKPGDLMRGEVLERYPNGNYKIKALKRILYKKGNPRLISLVGTIKGNDISEDTETVLSSKLYNYHLEVLSLLR